MRDHAAEPDGDGYPMRACRGTPAVDEVPEASEDERQAEGPETHLGLLVAFVATGEEEDEPVREGAGGHSRLVRSRVYSSAKRQRRNGLTR